MSEHRDPGIIRGLRRLTTLSRAKKVALCVGMDAALCIAATWIAFSLRLGEWRLFTTPVKAFAVVALGIWLPTFLLRGIYRSVIRFIGSRTIMRIVSSCALLMAVLICVFGLNSVEGVPRTVSVIHPLVFCMLLMMSRVTIRYVMFDLLNQRDLIGPKKRVIVYGAGNSGRQLAATLRLEPTLELVGYLDDDARLDGQHLDGMRVYSGERGGERIDELAIDMVLLAIPSLSRAQRERIVRSFDGRKVQVMVLPNVRQFVHGEVSISDLRAIEVVDLLGRDPVPPNHLLLHRSIQDKVVLVTGAGGSIGSELCRQIIALGPRQLVLVDMNEYALYAIEDELSGLRGDRARVVTPELSNIADATSAARIFAKWHPDTVFHAAAYKHVPLIEANWSAGLTNNIVGTLNCAVEAERAGTRNFILVSTDKAVRPTNVMGASKRTCELILQALAARGSKTRFTMVRFGNVLGSSGSVVPRFQRQIQSGGPVTLTHADITRYFMTIPEAAQLVIQAGAMAEGGEVYVLDMGEPVRIYDLARTMISLSGLTVRDDDHPDGDIEIRETGLRPGEKLYEELLIGADSAPTSHPRILQAREALLEWSVLQQRLSALFAATESGDRREAMTVLGQLVPEYRPDRREGVGDDAAAKHVA